MNSLIGESTKMKISNTIIFSSLLLAIVLFVSCKKRTEAGRESLIFDGYAKNLKAFPGKNRAKLTFMAEDDNIDYFVVTWNNKSQSRKIHRNEATNNVLETIIEGLTEGTHTFEILAYDKTNNSAIASVAVQVKVYGSKYAASLQNREVKDLTFIFRKDPVIEWSNALAGETALEINYLESFGKPIKSRVASSQTSVTLPAYQQNTPISYRSLYLPVAACLDTFYSSPVTIPAPAYYTSVATKNVIEKSGLVKEVLSQFSSDVSDGLEYSTLQFKDQSDLPLSVFILRADLSGGKLTLSPLMPDDDTKFGLQTVKAMAESREQDGGKVLAAVNADFFDWSPVAGTPWGPVIINGTIVKDYAKSQGLTYFGIKKDGKLQIEYSSSLPKSEYANFKGLVGGGAHWLVVNGVDGSWGGDTREPRTSAGYTNDQVVYLVVVDGRKPEYSVGLELTDVAKIMRSLGTYQAINLDGGGSSTMVIKEDGAFKIVNQYSGSAPRAVANGLAIVASK